MGIIVCTRHRSYKSLLSPLLGGLSRCQRPATAFRKYGRGKQKRQTLLYWQKRDEKPESEETSMDYITLSPEMDLPKSLDEIDPNSIYAAFQQVTDRRHKRGIRYPLAVILPLLVLAKLAGEPKLSGVSRWVRLRGTWLNEHLHLQRTSWPAASTYTYV